MSQEKQKVIRVLKPVQKKKSLSPVYYAVAGVTFGVALTSVLIFSVLGKDSSQPQVNAQQQQVPQTQQPVAQEQSNEIRAPMTTAQALDDDPDAVQTHDDYQQPQPKLNDISNAFKPQQQVVAQEQKPSNPFANASGQPSAQKPTAATTNQVAKPVVKAAPVITAQAKPSTQTQTPAKPVTKKPDIEKAEEKVLAKAVPVKPAASDQDGEVDLPKGTVQVTVTRSVKE